MIEQEARDSDYASNIEQLETRHRLKVFTVSEFQLNIFDEGCRECCTFHTIAYCRQIYEGVGRNIYYTIQCIVGT